MFDTDVDEAFCMVCGEREDECECGEDEQECERCKELFSEHDLDPNGMCEECGRYDTCEECGSEYLPSWSGEYQCDRCRECPRCGEVSSETLSADLLYDGITSVRVCVDCVEQYHDIERDVRDGMEETIKEEAQDRFDDGWR